MSGAYYNEIDPYAAEWLRNLIAARIITGGEVDTRSIVDVQPLDLRGFERCHFFAGIGVWDYALGLAGWPADRPVWTGSCPCQPFSAAGKGGGVADERHLWPHWHHLIRECRPPAIFGEQVASKDGLGWLDLVQADLEGEGYAVGAADLCAAGVGAPHIRQRLWLYANALADTPVRREPGGLREWGPPERVQRAPRGCRPVGGMADTNGGYASAERLQRSGQYGQQQANRMAGFWSTADWIACRDGKARPVEPGTLPLAHGAPARMGRLRAYGNAICAEAAATFIGAVMDVRP